MLNYKIYSPYSFITDDEVQDDDVVDVEDGEGTTEGSGEE